MKTHERSAQTEAVGAIFFIVLATVVFALFGGLALAQYFMAQQVEHAQDIAGNKAHENLVVSIQSGNSTLCGNNGWDAVFVTNNGPQTAVITYYIVEKQNQKQNVNAMNNPVAVAPGPNPQFVFCVQPPYVRVGVVTSYGNIWWSSQD